MHGNVRAIQLRSTRNASFWTRQRDVVRVLGAGWRGFRVGNQLTWIIARKVGWVDAFLAVVVPEAFLTAIVVRCAVWLLRRNGERVVRLVARVGR